MISTGTKSQSHASHVPKDDTLYPDKIPTEKIIVKETVKNDLKNKFTKNNQTDFGSSDCINQSITLYRVLNATSLSLVLSTLEVESLFLKLRSNFFVKIKLFHGAAIACSIKHFELGPF